mmetsp:Transcript_83581/g.215258  ORF Transcript_83581/g.215258 Transcript_83581/m.215258 type:complete len:157 (+) Transcript_83581:599-1069(+)
MLLVLRIDLIDDGVERATPRCRTSQESVGHAAVYGRGTLAGLTLPSERFESAQYRAKAALMLVPPRRLASGTTSLSMGSLGDAFSGITGHEGDPCKEICCVPQSDVPSLAGSLLEECRCLGGLGALGCTSAARFLASTCARIACHQAMLQHGNSSC